MWARNENKLNQNGFTIIEVVLVLAIAGLIFLIVFIALPQLQSSRRDTQRKSTALSLLAATQGLARFPVNNGEHQQLVNKLDDEHNIDPKKGVAYDIPFRDSMQSHSDIPTVGEIFVQAGHVCGTGSDPIDDAPSGHSLDAIAVWVGLETGQYACFDNL